MSCTSNFRLCKGKMNIGVTKYYKNSEKLSYHTVTKWVCAFQSGRESWEHKLGTEQSVTAMCERHHNCWLWTDDGHAPNYHMRLVLYHPWPIQYKEKIIHKVCIQWVPHNLTGVQTWECTKTATLHLDHHAHEGEAFLWWIITREEMYKYEPELKRVKWVVTTVTMPMETSTRAGLSEVKVWLLPMIMRGFLWHMLYPVELWQVSGITGTSWNYLHSALCHKQPYLLHNTWRQVAKTVTDLFKQRKWVGLEHPLYSLNMNLCDYDPLWKLKEPLQGLWFKTREEVIMAVGQVITDITKRDTWWCQMSSRSVAMHLWQGRRL